LKRPAVIPRKENPRIRKKDSQDTDSQDTETDPPDRGINRQRGNCSGLNKKGTIRNNRPFNRLERTNGRLSKISVWFSRK
jgi:hypothetical protein